MTIARILVSSLLVAGVSSAYAKVLLTTSGDMSTYDIDVEKVMTTPVKAGGQDFVRAKFLGVGNMDGVVYRKGYPEIPVVRFYVNANDESDIEVVAVNEKSGAKTDALPVSLYPAQESLAKMKGATVRFSMNQAFYQTSEFYPKKMYSISDAGSIDGVPRKLVTLYPMSYNAADGRFRLLPRFIVNIFRRHHDEQQPLVSNAAETFAFVIGKKYKSSAVLNDYMNFKASLGYKIEKIIVGEGVNTPDQIRAALQDIYGRSDSKLKYAMIVGDIEDVPAKAAAHLDTSGLVTDNYYRCIDTNDYDSDINAPDIGLGRITPKNENELANTLGKFLKYQRGTFGSEEWLKSISFIATDDRYQVAEGSHNYAINTYTKDLGYTGIFPQNPMAGGDQLYAITHRVSNETVVNAMKQGRFIVNYSGHGATTYWAGPTITQANVRSLNHPDAMPFVISNACITGQFNIDESFGETWIKHPNGAIMYWGSMDSSYWDEDDILERAMYDGIFKLGTMAFADITQHSLDAVWKYYNGQNRSKYYMETYTTFGDPSIHLRTTPSRAVQLQGPETVVIGMPDVSFKLVDASGKPVANARVILSTSTQSNVAMTNATGDVTLSLFDTGSDMKYTITAYADNAKLMTKDLRVISADYPFFVLSSIQANDRESANVSVQEDLALHMLVKNVAQKASKGGKITITNVQGPATIISKEALIPAMAAESSFAYEGNDLRVKVGNGANGDTIAVTLKWENAEGKSATTTQSFRVIRAQLAVTSVDFGDVANPDLGGIPRGGEGHVFLTVKNTGDEIVRNASLDASKSTCVRDSSGTITIHELAPGAVIRIETPIDVSLDATCAGGMMGQINIKGNYVSAAAMIDIRSMASFRIGQLGKVRYENAAVALSIPDNAPAVSANFALPGIGSISDISVRVKITHPYVGDLVVTLIHPNGTRVVLHNKAGGSQDNLDEIYGMAVADMNKLMGLSSAGNWAIEVQDTASGDVGTLDLIQVDVKGYLL